MFSEGQNVQHTFGGKSSIFPFTFPVTLMTKGYAAWHQLLDVGKATGVTPDCLSKRAKQNVFLRENFLF